MNISTYHRTSVNAEIKQRPLNPVGVAVPDGYRRRMNKGIRAAWRADKRADAAVRQAAYDAEFSGRHPQVGAVRRAGRKLREDEL